MPGGGLERKELTGELRQQDMKDGQKLKMNSFDETDIQQKGVSGLGNSG